MSFKLFEIPEQIELIGENLVDPETGEMLTEEEARAMIDSLEEEKDKKVEYLCKLIKNYKAEADALKTQKQSFDARQKAAERKAESIKNYLKFALKGEKWKAEDASVSISYRNTKDTVKIDDLDSIDEMYFKCPHTESNLSKTMIKEALKNGDKVVGAHLEDSVSIIIK